MPSLHPIVPFQFSRKSGSVVYNTANIVDMTVLDLEQLLIEKPTRSKALSEALVKAIGGSSCFTSSA